MTKFMIALISLIIQNIKIYIFSQEIRKRYVKKKDQKFVVSNLVNFNFVLLGNFLTLSYFSAI